MRRLPVVDRGLVGLIQDNYWLKGTRDESVIVDSLQKEGRAVNSDGFKQAFERVKAGYTESPAQLAGCAFYARTAGTSG